MHRPRLVIAALATAATVALARPATVVALPDLLPEIYDLTVGLGDVLQGDVTEGCAGGRYDRRLVKFTLRTRNIGVDDLVMGDPGCPNCSLNPGAGCTNPLFVCGTAHGHAHFESFAKTEILDENDVVVAEGRKYGFCLLDLNCPNPHYSCSYQGITAGCYDVYSAGLPCQYVDITDDLLPDGLYKLRLTIDPDNELAESDDTNNVALLPFTIGETAPICSIYASEDVPKAIADAGTMSSTISIPDIGAVTSLRLRMKGTHTYLGDLDATLTSPEATTRTLFSRICTTADNFDLYLGDDTVDPLICPATDASVLRKPAQSFAPYLGQEAGGDWTLTITDQSANDSGSLQQWSLEVCAICGNGIVDAAEVCDDGNVAGGDCCSADCQVQASDGTSCEDGNACTIDGTCAAGACVEGGELECDPCLICSSSEGCVVPDLVYPCQQPPTGGAKIQIRHDETDPTRDSLLWKWRSETPVELDEFGAPDVVTDISLCVYSAGELVLSSTIPAAQNCNAGEPCWLRSEHDALFSDRSGGFGGLSMIRIREGAKGKVLVKGFGEKLAIPGLYLSLPTTVRLNRSDGTPCWEANFDTTRISSADLFRARSR